MNGNDRPVPETELTERFQRALLYAASAHAGQTKKGGEIPYVSHLLAVAAIVLNDGGDETEAIAGLLHDAAEDQGGRERLEDIRRTFGDRIADIVEACSDTLESPKPPWKPRKEAFIERFRAERDPSILRVELADKLDNARAIVRDLREIGDEVWDRFNAPKECQLWYYRVLVRALADGTDGELLREVDATVSEMERLSGGPSERCPDDGST
jgi:(p)ppGpp synthase/HD superfamily hydrolase